MRHRNHEIKEWVQMASLLFAAAAMSACSDRQVSPTAMPASSTNASSSGSGEGGDDSALDGEGSVPSDCISEDDCDKATLVVKMVDMKSGGTIDELKGFTGAQIVWGLKVVPRGGDNGRQILMKVVTPPDELEVARKANTVVIMGVFGDATSGSLDIVSRDVDYCEKHHSKPKECDDLDEELEDFDTEDSVPYRVVMSAEQKAMTEAEQKAKSAQSKASMINCATGLFSVFTGNIAGAAGCVGAVAGGL